MSTPKESFVIKHKRGLPWERTLGSFQTMCSNDDHLA